MKKGEMSAWGYIGSAVLTIILIMIIMMVLFPNLWRGIKEIPACKAPNVCGIDNCQDGYAERMIFGSGYCEDEGLGNICCFPTERKIGTAVGTGDITITADGDITKPITNGGVVEMRLDNDGAKLDLDMAYTDVAKYVCYGQIKEDGKPAVSVSIDKLFEKLSPSDILASNTKITDLAAKCEPPNKANLKVDLKPMLESFGKETAYSVVLLDKEKCKDKEIRQCPPVHTQTIIVKVPNRRPAISFKEGTVEFSRSTVNALPVGSHNLLVEINEPYPICEIETTLQFGDENKFSDVLEQFGFSGDRKSITDCFNADKITMPIRLDIDDDVVRGIPFEVTIATMTNKDDKAARVEETFKFQIPEHAEFKVIGPATGLAREKSVDIICNNIQCNSLMEVALIQDPFACKPDGDVDVETWSKVETATVEGSNRFRFTIKDQYESEKYVCVKGQKAGDDIFALGLWRGVPSQIFIDNEPPVLELEFDYIRGKISFSCKDTSENPAFMSGCKEDPFSYSYISDPLRFVGHVVPLGNLFGLGDRFGGCPDGNAESQWVQWNGALNEMDYLGQDIRVLCMRATDNAGNHEVKSKLLFSTTQAVSLLMQAVGQEVVR